MNIASTPAVQAATSATQSGASGDAVQILVMKKALDLQAAGAAKLIEAIPQLASDGSIGTQVNTFA